MISAVDLFPYKEMWTFGFESGEFDEDQNKFYCSYLQHLLYNSQMCMFHIHEKLMVKDKSFSYRSHSDFIGDCILFCLMYDFEQNAVDHKFSEIKNRGKNTLSMSHKRLFIYCCRKWFKNWLRKMFSFHFFISLK